MSMRCIAIPLALTVWVGLQLTAAPAGATVITIGFSGLINYVEEDLPLDRELPVGTLFSGVYSYDSSAVDTAPDDPIVGGYRFPDYAMTVRVGDVLISQGNIGLAVYNYSFFDIYSAQTLSPFFAFGLEWEYMNVYLVNHTGTALTNDSLPLDAPNLNDFDARSIDWGRPFQGATAISGEITWMGRLPEPATAGLLCMGVGLGLRRRRGRRRP